MKPALTVCAAVAWLLFAPVRSPGSTVSMFDHVQISGDQILLSDLVPSGVFGQDLSRCAAIPFGKAPALGSVRVLTRSDINRGLQQRPDCAREILAPDQV